MDFLPRHAGIVALLLLAALLTACSGTGSTEPADAPPPSSADVPESSPSLPAGTPGTVVVTGTVQSGVENGCLILKGADGKTYELVGQPRPAVGATVTIEGTVAADMVSICMQGTPLVIASLRSGSPGTSTPS